MIATNRAIAVIICVLLTLGDFSNSFHPPLHHTHHTLHHQPLVDGSLCRISTLRSSLQDNSSAVIGDNGKGEWLWLQWVLHVVVGMVNTTTLVPGGSRTRTQFLPKRDIWVRDWVYNEPRPPLTSLSSPVDPVDHSTNPLPPPPCQPSLSSCGSFPPQRNH